MRLCRIRKWLFNTLLLLKLVDYPNHIDWFEVISVVVTDETEKIKYIETKYKTYFYILKQMYNNDSMKLTFKSTRKLFEIGDKVNLFYDKTKKENGENQDQDREVEDWAQATYNR